MTRGPMTRRSLLSALFLLAAAPLCAQPATYRLQPEKSVVAFETDYGPGGLKISGRMPVATAALHLDFARVAASTVSVDVNAAGAVTSNPLATEAMNGAKVLDVATYPVIHFESTAIRADGDTATVTGNITIRGITRPMTMIARFYRQQGTAAGDMRNLSILLTGAVSRAAFGAAGFPDLVGDQVRLKILARITLDG